LLPLCNNYNSKQLYHNGKRQMSGATAAATTQSQQTQ
jgi:hypothetical protein